jgi:acetyl esterase/lipase
MALLTRLFAVVLFASAGAACESAALPTAPTVTVETTATTVAPVDVTTRSWSNVAYAHTSAAQVLDITLPASGNGPFPVVVYIHGGAFSAGSKSQGAPARAYLVSAGYAVASIDYRLSGEAKFPAQIYDVKAAIRFLKANAATYALNASRIATWGTSAGAGLAALAGTSGGVTTLEDLSLGNASQTSRVQAFVDLFGPINFLTMDSELRELGLFDGTGHDAPTSPESRLLGVAIQTRPDLCALYNPETYISADDPPAFIQHGAADNQIPYLQGQHFSEKLAAALGSSQVRWTLIPGAKHSDPAFDNAGNLATLVAFLDQHLK